ncbi:DUF1573 domain-containing protein [Geobacter pickeringii]|uniref:HYDIN/VesB/CFA65-like Ig-like domain-containing protein n=1 Tax=Geobacter pickeringii TaxID=345632 RepID=A0A0B5B843_9BACT|nr:DUF1573 domain-containing protein [Geobacter pickeringii]AJE02722.1 hypothetical protein GPICK_04485 [Geobacter pickeringii]
MYRRSFLPTLVIALFTAVAPALAAPVISADRPVFDFGTITAGKKVDHVFTLKNRGDAPLAILKTKTSCGCTVANVSTKSIEPGRTAELKTTFDSANFSGKITKTITVETNDPATPSFTLTVKGTIREELVVSPRQLNLGVIKVGGSKEVQLTVENHGERPVKIVSVTTPMPQVKAAARRTALKPGENATITVTVTPRNEDRFLSGYLAIGTDIPGRPEISVPLYGSVGK